MLHKPLQVQEANFRPAGGKDRSQKEEEGDICGVAACQALC